MSGKFGWFLGGFVAAFLLIFVGGGMYTITPPNGPVDVAYKVNRLTGNVWMIKTFSKPVGPVRVLAAREAQVEDTKDIATADVSSLPLEQGPAGKR